LHKKKRKEKVKYLEHSSDVGDFTGLEGESLVCPDRSVSSEDTSGLKIKGESWSKREMIKRRKREIKEGINDNGD